MAAEGPGGVPALVRLSAERRVAFKGPRCTTAPMHVACAVDGREFLISHPLDRTALQKPPFPRQDGDDNNNSDHDPDKF